MTIFVIPSSYKSEYNTQANIFVHEQCQSLIAMGHKVVVLDATTRSKKQWGHKFCKAPAIRYENEVKVYSYWVRGIAKTKLPHLATWQFKKNIFALWKLAVKNEGIPDIIYAHFTFPSGFCSLSLSEKYNVPLVIMEHAGMYLTKNINKYIAFQLKCAVNKADRFFCVSNAHLNRIKEITGTNSSIEVIPNMISSNFNFSPVKCGSEFIFFSAGNLKPVKRFDLLINAFCDAFDKQDKVFLFIAGDGDEKEKLNAMIKEKNRERQIILLGRLNREQMLEWYKKCNAFVLASEHESFGIVYREATACGRPVVSTLNGGIDDGWDDSFGRVVPCGDQKALSDALNCVYKNYEIFSQEEISSKTLSYCSEKVVMKKVETILLQTIGEK